MKPSRSSSRSLIARILLLMPDAFRSISLNLRARPSEVFTSVQSAHFRPRTPRLGVTGYVEKLSVTRMRPRRRGIATKGALHSFAYHRT